MKWSVEDLSYGDIIRVKFGSIYHFGIYVSDDEVIQFGYPPVLREKDKDHIVVVSTDIDTFSCGQLVEVGSFTFFDHKKRLRPEITVETARQQIGQGGYDLIHNNCEHFAMMCYSGIRFSYQEEEMRKKWENMPLLNVYIGKIPEEIDFEEVYPKERQKEIESVKNEKVKRQKYMAWKILQVAFKHCTDLKFKDQIFKKNKEGQWTTKKCYFSISHTEDLVVVALSNHPVGVDVELQSRNISLPISLVDWTKKEAVFKYLGKGHFDYQKIDESLYPVDTYNLKNKYYLSVASDIKSNISIFVADQFDANLYNDKVSII